MLVVAWLATLGMAPARGDTPPHRPAYHFSPALNWMNDPNGLVFHKGVHHLFYQHNPHGSDWGNMSWGHATSTDLVHWDEQAIAIPFDADEEVFSGSVVVDTTNSSGFGTEQNLALVAIYTSVYTAASGREGIQAQSLAYSTDDGQTWTKFSGNPVIDIGSREFRDPKVFWYEPAQEWRMVAVVANEHKILIWRSADLKQWTRLSDFGPRNAVGGVWECPDLFPLAVDGDPDNLKWVILVSLNPGGIAGGSGSQYFVGDFDGTTFTPDGPASYEPPDGTLLPGFENGYAGWTVRGTAFGSEPASGSVSRHQPDGSDVGEHPATRFIDVDVAHGELTSPAFTIDRTYLNFLIGGGRHPAIPGTPYGDPDDEVFTDVDKLDPATHLPAGWSATEEFVSLDAAGAGLRHRQGGEVPATGVVPDECAPAVGSFVSPEFTVSKGYVNILMAGEAHPLGTDGPTVVELVSGGAVTGSVTGTRSGEMDWRHMDAKALLGRQARIVVRNDHGGGDWGRLMVDSIRFSDRAAGPRDTQTTVHLVVGGQVVRSSTGSDSAALDWASWDLSDLQGRTAQIRVHHSSGDGGHILADRFMLASAPARSGTDRAAWLDFGRDNYAAVTFNGPRDHQRIAIAWMNNWQYASDVPTDRWRGQMTMPRALSLASTTAGPRLRQAPVPGVDAVTVTRDERRARMRRVAAGETPTRLTATVARVEVRVALGSASEAGVVLRRSADGTVGTKVGVRRDGTLVVDRTCSGDVGFGPLFGSVEEASLRVRNGAATFTAFLDRSSVEVFAEGGGVSVTDLIYPPASATGVAAYAVGGRARAVDITVTPIRP